MIDCRVANAPHNDELIRVYLKGLWLEYLEKLHPEGITSIWSASADQLFTIRLKKAGFNVKLRTVRARPGKGSRHTIFVAQKPGLSTTS